jgi:aerobic-type carbon monoxide dehydrogenase small subunit (CoxS/CutS family)
MPKYTLNINNTRKQVEVDSDTPLLYVLRDQLQLNGPKFGCGIAQCGSCMVLIDGKAIVSCTLPVSAIAQSEITTLEGLADKDGNLHAVQQAVVKEQAAQCGYCLNGVIISAVSLLNSNPNPEVSDIKEALYPNLCRCGAHTRMIKAVITAKTQQPASSN